MSKLVSMCSVAIRVAVVMVIIKVDSIAMVRAVTICTCIYNADIDDLVRY